MPKLACPAALTSTTPGAHANANQGEAGRERALFLHRRVDRDSLRRMLVAALRHMLRRVLAGLRALHPRTRRRRQGGAGAGAGAAPASKARVTVRRLGSNGSSKSKATTPHSGADGSAPGEGRQPVIIRVATFNAALFSMAPAVAAVPEAGAEREAARRSGAGTGTGARPRPKGILKAQASLLSRAPSKARVSINLQDNEISLDRSGKLGSPRARKPQSRLQHVVTGGLDASRRRSVEEVLRETGADIIGLQNVRAEEERGMRPLSELAGALGMRYVFAESWAPEYGTAVLSRWPIKRWKALRVADQSDFRNVLRATIEVPRAGEVNFHCTHLDHLDESWRMKQVNAMLRSVDGPHILAGGLNALDGTDYSADRWADIVKYYEEVGKPTPKVEVMKYLKGKQYVDAKDFAGECEAVVVVAKGQDVQGTCKYGTRVDYILASPSSPYKFVPGSYTVVSSKGTSDHHIVRVDVAIVPDTRDADEQAAGGRKQRVVKMSKKGSRKGIWAAK